MSVTPKAVCARCVHFRKAPYEAKREGCYHPSHIQSKQKDPVLDEQQIPGNHERINRAGDCAEFEPRPSRSSFWERLLHLGR